MIELYGSYTSPFVRHCRIAVLETAATCSFVEADAAVSGKLSPTKRVPFLIDRETDTILSDSTSILMYLRESSEAPFLDTVDQMNRYCLVNTLLDTSINLFFMERDGLDITSSKYLKRQQARIADGLQELNGLPWPLEEQQVWNDAELRLGCFLDWALFRQRIDLGGCDHLVEFLDAIRRYIPFANTAPPAG